MLRRISTTILVLLFCLVCLPKGVQAIYDPLSTPNNKFGIHILDTSEIGKAKELVNSGGGDWGYVTIPIRSNDRDLDKWTRFMQDCSKLHVIPILRIASFPSDEHWMAPNEFDLLDFSNFLNDLPWPTKNRYVVIYNEPNHDSEWGGFVYPEEYARVLDRAVDIFHKKNPDFFVVSAGFDASAPNSGTSENVYSYIQAMNGAIPGIFSEPDGIAFHAYGNPAFSSFPNFHSTVNIGSYKYELAALEKLGVASPKIFITEAGWNLDLIGDLGAQNFYLQAYNSYWTEDNIVAITPFLLSAQAGAFSGFSFTDGGGNFKPFVQSIISLPKIKGRPQLSNSQPVLAPTPKQSTLGYASSIWTRANQALVNSISRFLGSVGILSR